MPATWYCADSHLSHAFVSKLRGHDSIESWNEEFIETWLDQVKPADTVFVLGDTAASNRGHEDALRIFNDLPGFKHLIAGNHDPVHPMHQKKYSQWFRRYIEVFETVQPFRAKKIAGRKVLLSHFPYAEHGDGEHREGSRYDEYRLPNLGMPLVHGHTHGTEQAHGNMFHVGWDAWGRLVHEGEIAEWVRSL